jgi:hypothetical protein
MVNVPLLTRTIKARLGIIMGMLARSPQRRIQEVLITPLILLLCGQNEHSGET